MVKAVAERLRNLPAPGGSVRIDGTTNDTPQKVTLSSLAIARQCEGLLTARGPISGRRYAVDCGLV
jgi:hypothetical protein